MNTRTPEFIPGFLETIVEFKRRGGIVTVVSHSPADIIEKHYEAKGNGFKPDRIWGWRPEKSERKPSPWPCEQILKEFNLKPEECLVLDDLSPGIKMAVSAGVPAATSAWCHTSLIGELEKCGSAMTFREVEAFRKHVLGE